MFTTRPRRVLLIGGSAALALTALVVTAELAVRSHLDAVVASRAAQTPGIAIEPAGGSALWALATGRVSVIATVPDAALQRLVECRTDRAVTVTTTAEGVGMDTEIALRGLSAPVHVTLVPRLVDGRWTFVTESVAVAGFTLAPSRVGAVLDGRAPDWMSNGVPLDPTAGMTVTNVAVSRGAVRITVDVPVPSGGSGGAVGSGGAGTAVGLAPPACDEASPETTP